METPAPIEEKKGRNLFVKRRSDFLQEHSDLYPYVKKWYSKPFYPVIRQDENFWSFLNHKELKKEITEAYAIYKQVKILIKQIETTNIERKDIVLLDVCSGKGYASTLLSFMFPNIKIHMIDKDRVMNVSHVKSLKNVTMHYMNINGPEFKKWIQSTVKDKFAIVLGTHLCGELSCTFVQLYNEIDEIQAMVLAPCCLSKRLVVLTNAARKLKIDNFMYWTLYLYHMVRGSRKDIKTDENVCSIKNSFIIASKFTYPIAPPVTEDSVSRKRTFSSLESTL